jgi:hypothetical protein
MSSSGIQAPRRRTGLVLLILAIPAVVIVGVAATLISVRAAHSSARWNAVNKTCPTLDRATAAALGMAPAPLPDDNSRGAHDTSELRNCFYSPVDYTNNAMQITVSLYKGGILHSSHGEAVAALNDDPPAGFRSLGNQNGDAQRFGDRGAGSGRLVLINVIDNAQIRVQLYNREKLANATDDTKEALRAPLQAVADQAVENLG